MLGRLSAQLNFQTLVPCFLSFSPASITVDHENTGYALNCPDMPNLQGIPVELISWVGDYLEIGELADFARTATKFYHVTDPALYKRARYVGYSSDQRHQHPLRWAAKNGSMGTIWKCLAAGFDVNMQLDEVIPLGTRNNVCSQMRAEALEGARTRAKGDTVNMAQESGDIEDALRDQEPFDDLPVQFLWNHPHLMHPHVEYRSRNSEAADFGPCQCAMRALHLAVVGGHDEVVEVLLDHGADIDAPSKNVCDCPTHADRLDLNMLLSRGLEDAIGPSSLHLAICHYRESTVKLLLRRGASTQTSKPFLTPSATALHTAAATGQASMCRYLLDKGYVQHVDIPDGSKYGLTPLYWAVYNGHWKTTVSALLEKGANINVWIALHPGDAEFLDSGDSLGRPDESVPIFQTMLHEACENGRFEDALKLVRLGADITKGRLWGGSVVETALHAACSHSATQKRPPFKPPINLSQDRGGGEDERCELIRVLFQEGADIDAVSYERQGRSPLYLAASHHMAAAVKVLLAAGADVHFQAGHNLTPLLAACDPCLESIGEPYSDAYHTVKLLLDYGSKTDATDDRGDTALHYLGRFVMNSLDFRIDLDMRLIRLLLDRGVDESARNGAGRKALQEVFCENLVDICNLILRHRKVAEPLTFKEVSEMIETVITHNAHRGTDCFQVLLDLDTDSHLASTSEFIMRLCDKGNDMAVWAYLERKPPRLNAAEKGKILHLAVKERCEPLIKHMLALKAPVNRIDANGHTPLYTAMYTSNVHQDARELVTVTKDLLAAGADIHFRHHPGTLMTPLERAITRRKTPAIKAMLRHRPLRGDPEAPKGVYLHVAAALGPDGREIVDLLLRSGATLTELDANGDTPLGSFLRGLMNKADWMLTPRKTHRQVADEVCAMIQQLWTKDINIRAKNRAGKSIIGYLAALKLYQGDDMNRAEVASQLRQRIKVVPVPGSKHPEDATLEFQALGDE